MGSLAEPPSRSPSRGYVLRNMAMDDECLKEKSGSFGEDVSCYCRNLKGRDSRVAGTDSCRGVKNLQPQVKPAGSGLTARQENRWERKSLKDELRQRQF